ncbi:acyltransferase family protein [Rhizobium leguminosarum]|uniref:acyltransferase family protein n=1 Tax=Rhizobium leguminosarum TaxID=384 RepID=UPI003D0543CB
MLEQSPTTGHSAMDGNRLAGIHGLRFLAAAMVLVFHLRDVAGSHPPIGFDIYLGSGVRLFFVISAFSLMYSTARYVGRADWIRVFALKRFFRIAPMFYIAGVIGWIMGLSGSPTISEAVLSIFFVFNFFPDQIGSLTWAGWTIGVEMIFYSIMPTIIGTVYGLRSAFAFLLIAILIGFATLAVPTHSALPSLFILMTFPSQIQFFAAGVCAFFIFLWFLNRERPLPSATLFAVVLIPVLMVCTWSIMTQRLELLPTYTDRERDYISCVVAFGALVVWQALRPSWIFSNRFVVYWGERSYSIYLLHGPILIAGVPIWRALDQQLGTALGYVATGLVSLTLVLTASWITYRFVETPGMRAGARFYGKSPERRPLGEW